MILQIRVLDVESGFCMITKIPRGHLVVYEARH